MFIGITQPERTCSRITELLLFILDGGLRVSSVDLWSIAHLQQWTSLQPERGPRDNIISNINGILLCSMEDIPPHPLCFFCALLGLPDQTAGTLSYVSLVGAAV